MIRRIRAIGEPVVPLNDTYPLSVTFIAAPRTNGDIREVTPIGTGFLVGWPHPDFPHAHSYYIVTAKHVVQSEPETYVRFRTKGGGLQDFSVHDWVLHPSPTADVAVTPIQIPEHVSVMHVSVADILGSPVSAAERTEWSPTLGDRVYFIGLLDYFEGMVEKNVPMVRSGTLGAMYQDDVPVKTDPHTVTRLHAHLIDCRSYGGFSGSPCFVQGTVVLAAPEPGKLRLSTPGRLLGLISGHFDMLKEAETNDSSLKVKAAINSGVGVVATAEQILEVLTMEEIAGPRKESQDRYSSEREARSGDIAATADTTSLDTEFDRFEDLTRKLVNTPKSKPDVENES